MMIPALTSRSFTTALCVAVFLSILSTAYAVDTRNTRMLSEPAVSSSHVAFVYAQDLWVCDLDGKNVKRLTTHKGSESRPRFSPDGKFIAFSGQYDGNTDVYLIPVEGGVPVRLTWHPGADLVQDFAKDGATVLFTSGRAVYSNRHLQLFEVSVDGGHPQGLNPPHVCKGCYSPEGKKLAYVPLRECFNQWKNYRGGTYSRIWLYDRADYSVVEIPQPEDRCNDTDPMWVGEYVYFRSDRAGEFNLHCYNLNTKEITQVSFHEDFPVVNCSAGPGHIAYEQAGYVHLHALENGMNSQLPVAVAADLIETRPRYVSDSRYIRGGGISPSGSRAVVGYRGEIVTVPAKKGDPRNLTRTPGVHEHTPAWSPDGKRIAFFSDASGEYALHVVNQDGKGEVEKFALDGAGFYDMLRWAPDSKKICFSDNSWTLRWLDLEKGEIHKISSEPIYGPNKTQSYDWSHDSHWIAYTQTTPTYIQQVFLYSVDEKKSHPVTDGLSDVGEPAFDKSGKYLYMTASTDAGPVRQWFAQSNADMQMSNALYLAVLQKDVPSPFKRESDEEKVKDEPADKPEEKAEKESGEDSDKAAEEGESAEEDEEPAENDAEAPADGEEDKDKPLQIDFEGIENRILAMPGGSGMYRNLRAGSEGNLYYLKADQGAGRSSRFSGLDLYCFDLKKREAKKLTSGVLGFTLNAKGDKMLLATGRGSLSIVKAGPGINAGANKLPTDRIRVKIEPAVEWAQIFDEAWRINRDCFYDPNMHGADWPAMREKYKVFLPHLAVRSDLNRVIMWLCSELSVGHHNVYGGDFMNEADRVSGGLLGADYEVQDGRYCFKKIFGGLNWNPNLRSPLTEPGVNVKVGDYLLEVEGVPLEAPENLYSRFENRSGRSVEITVGPNPDGTDSKTVTVEPISNEGSLRNRDWVEGNLKRVDEATQGRVAYVYVPNTAGQGHTYFKRYFFPQAHKQAIIIDERSNGGGQVADYYIDLLRRPYLCHWATRYGNDFKTPLSSIQGPKVMIIDETAGSGGDLLPWMFRKLELGTLVGRPTWGGLVGMLGFPPFMDGGGVTAPNLAIWTEDGFIVENVGVPPDIEVEMYPKDMIEGRDPQLEKAIEVALKGLEANPPVEPKKPEYPIRVRK